MPVLRGLLTIALDEESGPLVLDLALHVADKSVELLPLHSLASKPAAADCTHC